MPSSFYSIAIIRTITASILVLPTMDVLQSPPASEDESVSSTFEESDELEGLHPVATDQQPTSPLVQAPQQLKTSK